MSNLKTKEEKHKRLTEAIDFLKLYDKDKMAKSTNTNITLLYNYLNGKREIGEKFAVALYRAYGISVSFILEGKKPMLADIKEDLDKHPELSEYGKKIEKQIIKERVPHSSITNVPVFGYVYCGSPASQWDIQEVREFMLLPKLTKFKDPFGLVAKGDSMSPYINEHDVLICVDNPELIKDRTAVVVVYDSVDTIDANAKLFRDINDKEIMLTPINTKYDTEIVRKKSITKIYKVIRIIRDVK